MEKNAIIYKVKVTKGEKVYINYYIDINGFKVAISPKFLTKDSYKAFYYLVPNKEAK